MANVLVVDDDKAVCRFLSDLISSMGHDSACVLTLDSAREIIRTRRFDVIFLDVNLPDGNGLSILPVIKEIQRKCEVVIMTAAGDPDGAELAIQHGAWDYFEKPISVKKIQLIVNRVLDYLAESTGNRLPKGPLKLEGIIGSSPQIRACIDTLMQAANCGANVLITGETGTGKELFANGVHANSERSEKSFVVVDCAALPGTLVESTLFGYRKGAFTGADKDREGLFRQANGGTLFLDEVGELDMNIQKAFLRVLQERKFRPVGSKVEVESDFRLITATNRNLNEMVRNGQFRKDLLYRLKTLSIDLTSLREHPQDIKELILYHAEKICSRFKIAQKGFAPDFFDTLKVYPWPGNVRELIHALEKAISEAYYEPIIYAKHLPTEIRIYAAKQLIQKQDIPLGKSSFAERSQNPPDAIGCYRDFRQTVLASAEKGYFRDLMAATNGNIKQACKVSGLGRTRLYTLMKKNNISRNGWVSSETPL